MSADRTKILEEVNKLLTAISSSVLPGEQISEDTRIAEDLELQSLGFANLSGRIQTRYGAEANLVPFFASRAEGPFTNLRVGELVDYLTSVLSGAVAGGPQVPTGMVPGDAEGVMPAPAGGAADDDLGVLDGLSADGHRAKNDNTGVLRELAPGVNHSVLDLPDGSVEVFTAGDGPPLVLMHPINVGAGAFARQFATLASMYRLICIHRPGVGATTWAADVSLNGLARLQRMVLAQLGIPAPFHVLGSSFGGLVAQQFALLHLPEIASLTLVGCSYKAGARPGVRKLPTVVHREFERIKSNANGASPAADWDALEQLLLRCESMNPGTGMKYLDAFAARPSLFAKLPEITVPTLVLRGRHDSMVPAKDAHLLYGAIPNAEFAEVAEAGHFPYFTHPEAVQAELDPFLAANSRAAQTASLAVGGYGQPGVQTTLIPPPPPDPCTIILNSGRCGSTLLTALIAEEPQTLSISESLVMIRGHLSLQPLTPMTGAEYWALLSEPSQVGSLMERIKIVPSEYRYPDNGKFAGYRATIPPILYVTLPGCSSDPDLLYSVLCEKVPLFPAQPIGQHHKMLMNLLAQLASKRRWVERSGASSALAEPLLHAFPEAKIVYLTRSIEDTALSMSKHTSFQFVAARQEFHQRYGADPYGAQWRGERLPSPEKMPEELRALLPENITKDALNVLGQDVSKFEAMVAHMRGSAEQALADNPPRQLHEMTYEDLVASPVDELTRLGEFLGFADPAGWANQTAGRVRPSRKPAPAPA
jgi:pimeloyl-ACP methyl ester carboxylesterase